MTQPVATKLYWKLVYTDVVSALREYQDSTQTQPQFTAGSRVLFIHAQNGLGNRLRAIASGLVMARGTRRVPVVVWERDAHLGASFQDLFVTKAYGSDIATILYKDLIVMDVFPSWDIISKRQTHWFPVSLMEKDKGNPDALLRFSIPEKQVSLSEPRSLMDSMGAVGDVSSSDLQLTRAAQTDDKAVLSDRIDPSMHVYFKSAYVARTEPRHFSHRSNVNRELANLPPSDEVMKIAQTVNFSKLRSAIGIHIRARRLQNDNVDVNSRCEYSRVGAHRTDYWRHQSRLPVFEYKMKVLLERERHATFFVAADDVATITRLQTVFPGRVQSISRDCDDRNPDCVRYAMADLLCLSRTRRIYGSNWSSFSEAAGRLGNKRIFLSGRHFGKETKSERKRRLRSERLWRLIDRLPFVRLLNGCWMHDWLRGN